MLVRFFERCALDEPDAILELASDSYADYGIGEVASVEDPVCEM